MGRAPGKDEGGAMVEFLGMALLLLVPLVYLILALARIQAGSYAVELAAQEAARGAIVSGVAALESGAPVTTAVAVAERRASAIVDVALADFGFDGDGDSVLSLTCVPTCFAPGSSIVATVVVTVSFPGVPAGVRAWLPLEVTVGAESSSPVDAFASGP